VVIHIGGMSPRPGNYDRKAAHARCLESLAALETRGVDLLIENLPPYPWYFGGRWFGHVICDLESTRYLCEQSGLGLCFDVSHAALECAKSGASLAEFGRAVAPFVRHLHVSDGAGTSGEGLQIGEGNVNFVEVLPSLLAVEPTLIPEIWMGHHENGEGFRIALEHLTDIHWAGTALRRGVDLDARPELEALTVSVDASLFVAIRAIDENRAGIVFALDGDRRVVGVLTDGDVRHAFVRGYGLHSLVRDVATAGFAHGTVGMTPDELRDRLPGRTKLMPIVDADGRLVDYASLIHLPTTGPRP
jgi:CBS domain-containing protein